MGCLRHSIFVISPLRNLQMQSLRSCTFSRHAQCRTGLKFLLLHFISSQTKISKHTCSGKRGRGDELSGWMRDKNLFFCQSLTGRTAEINSSFIIINIFSAVYWLISLFPEIISDDVEGKDRRHSFSSSILGGETQRN